MKRTAILMAVVALASACPPPSTPDAGAEGEGEGEGEGIADPVAVDALCRAYAAGWFELVVQGAQSFSSGERCTMEDVFQLRDAGVDTATALDNACRPDGGFHEEFRVAVAGGRVRFDLAKIAGCAEAFDEDAIAPDATPTTNAPIALPVACTGLTEGLQGVGDPCVQDWDCPVDTYCQADPIDAVDLRCLPPAALGEPCIDENALLSGRLSARVCEADAFCDDGLCAALADDGSSCATIGCKPDLVCIDQVCDARRAAGQACNYDSDCQSGLDCDLAGFCNARKLDGATCDVDVDRCASLCSVCRPESVGGATKCLERSDLGGPCAVLDDCRHGTVCGPASLCIAAGGTGDPCTDDDECLDDFVCGANGCEAVPPPGDAGPTDEPSEGPGGPCTTTTDCRTGLFCDVDRCAPQLPGGASCTDEVQCLSRTCFDTGTCAAAGASCTSSKELFPMFIALGALFPLGMRLRRRYGR